MFEQWNKYGPTAARSHGKPGREAPGAMSLDTVDTTTYL